MTIRAKPSASSKAAARQREQAAMGQHVPSASEVAWMPKGWA